MYTVIYYLDSLHFKVFVYYEREEFYSSRRSTHKSLFCFTYKYTVMKVNMKDLAEKNASKVIKHYVINYIDLDVIFYNMSFGLVTMAKVLITPCRDNFNAVVITKTFYDKKYV